MGWGLAKHSSMRHLCGDMAVVPQNADEMEVGSQRFEDICVRMIHVGIGYSITKGEEWMTK